MPPTYSLDAFNFTLAGAREGFGPFLGVYLQHQGFDSARTGFAMSLAGLAGVAATLPLGALIDRVTAKRAAVVIAVACIAVGAGLIVATKQLWLVATGQILIGVADTSLAPLVAALTLGLVGQGSYAARVSRNEAFNHAGNAANAALAAGVGYLLGLGWVAIAIAVMAVATSAVMLAVDPGAIDHEAARGGKPDATPTWRVLWDNKALLVLAGTAFAFQAASGAMMPFIAQALTTQGHDPSLTTGAMAVGAQVAMVFAALLVPRLARILGMDKVLSLALLFVIIRAGLAAWSSHWGAIVAIQVLEGLAMGFAGVALPALASDAMRGSGHAGAGLGGVMMAYGLGAAASPTLAGLVTQGLGYPAAFMALGLVAGLGLILWTAGRRIAEGGTQSAGSSGAPGQPADRTA